MPLAPPLAAGGIPSFEPPMADAPGLATIPPLNAPNVPDFAPPATIETTSNFATVVVTLPADAKLFVEGQEWTRDAGLSTRTFRSPPLDPGRNYFYTFKIEVQRGGKTVPATQEARLQAGKTARVTFAELGTGTSQSLTRFVMLQASQE